MSRAYHGEQIREKQWQRMYRSNMPSVIPMSHAYLARTDGSEESAGRGSGLDQEGNERRVPRTPYTSMVYAPAERRLDTAIFRALFASSARQARQFVVHGAVKVNGKKVYCLHFLLLLHSSCHTRCLTEMQMIYPGYLLNPGDMFQVEPERVLYATGASKDPVERRVGRQIARKQKLARAAADPTDQSADESADSSVTTAQDLDDKSNNESSQSSKAAASDKSPGDSLKGILARAKSLLEDPSAIPAKRRQDLRAFQRAVKRALARPSNLTESSTTNFESELSELMSRLSTTSSSSPSPPTKPNSTSPASTSLPNTSSTRDSSSLDPEDQRALQLALREAHENPVDASKPYATPWRPRDFMSAFAFIPKYLEVNQSICSAVYLRHPVARPGLAEVPSPFQPEVHQLVHNWYLRRR